MRAPSNRCLVRNIRQDEVTPWIMLPQLLTPLNSFHLEFKFLYHRGMFRFLYEKTDISRLCLHWKYQLLITFSFWSILLEVMVYLHVNNFFITPFTQMSHFYTRLKTSESYSFSDVSRGFRNGTLAWKRSIQ